MEKKVSVKLIWQTVIVLVGLISAVLGIYAFFFQEKKMEIVYELLTNTNVIDLKADLSKLDITYDGKSLKSSNKSLRIISLKVKNSGNVSVLKTFYDDLDPLGITIEKGKIIEKPELIATSSGYIKRNLRIDFDSIGNLTFNDIILEPNDFYTVKLLVLCSNGIIPNFISIGKIAGLKEIPIVSFVPGAKKEPSFFERTFSGDILTQVTRIFSYAFILGLIMGAIIRGIISISDARDKRKKKATIKEFKQTSTYNYDQLDEIIFTSYEEASYYTLTRYYSLLEDEEVLNKIYRKWIDMFRDKDVGNVRHLISSENQRYPLENYRTTIRNEWKLINNMISDGYLIKDEDKLFVNQKLFSTLKLFMGYLIEIKVITKDSLKRDNEEKDIDDSLFDAIS